LTKCRADKRSEHRLYQWSW